MRYDGSSCCVGAERIVSLTRGLKIFLPLRRKAREEERRGMEAETCGEGDGEIRRSISLAWKKV